MQLTHSTLSFFDEVVQFHDVEHDSNYFDMMALADRHQNYFTGLYSSRENLKSLISRASKVVSAHNKLYSAQILYDELEWSKTYKYLNASKKLMSAVSEAQGEDGITGISKIELADKIAQKLQSAIEESTKVTVDIINEAARKIAGIHLSKDAKWSWCI